MARRPASELLVLMWSGVEERMIPQSAATRSRNGQVGTLVSARVELLKMAE